MTDSKLAARLIVELFEDGSVQLRGPLASKMLCYSLLELGRDEVFRYHEQRLKEQGGGLVTPSTDEVVSINGRKK